jgi:hypothetical protein
MGAFQTSRLFRHASRKLRFEALESRLALTAAPTAELVTLEQYLDQPPEMGPVIDQVALAALSAAPAEIEPAAAFPSSSVGVLEGEGEDWFPPPPPLPPLPILLEFSADRVDGGWVRLTGSISVLLAGVPISFGGLIVGHSTQSDATGHFQHFVPDPGSSGFVTANIVGTIVFLSDYLD